MLSLFLSCQPPATPLKEPHTCVHNLFRFNLIRNKALRADAALAVASAGKVAGPPRHQRHCQLAPKHLDLREQGDNNEHASATAAAAAIVSTPLSMLPHLLTAAAAAGTRRH